jgi:outer membrane protein
MFMKKTGVWMVGVVFVLSFVLTGSWAMAVEKTGFVDMGEILVKSDSGKKAEEQFKKIVDKDRGTIQEKENELKKLKDELEKQRPVLNENAMKAKELDYQKRFRDYQLLVKDANEELQAKRQDILKIMVPEIMSVIKMIGEKEQYTMIVDISSVPLAYFDKQQDITKRVIDEFNKTNKKK